MNYLDRLYEYFNRMMIDEEYFKTSRGEDIAHALETFNKRRKVA